MGPEPFSFSFFSVTGWGIGLDYCDIEWFALETNRDHSIIFETASKYCISDSFVDHDGYSISSKGFLPAGVDIMVIWVKFTHSILVRWFLGCWCSLLPSPVWPLSICLVPWTWHSRFLWNKVMLTIIRTSKRTHSLWLSSEAGLERLSWLLMVEKTF